MTKTAIRLRNDMVMVFDADGEKIPEYQVKYEDVTSVGCARCFPRLWCQ